MISPSSITWSTSDLRICRSAMRSKTCLCHSTRRTRTASLMRSKFKLGPPGLDEFLGEMIGRASLLTLSHPSAPAPARSTTAVGRCPSAIGSGPCPSVNYSRSPPAHQAAAAWCGGNPLPVWMGVIRHAGEVRSLPIAGRALFPHSTPSEATSPGVYTRFVIAWGDRSLRLQEDGAGPWRRTGRCHRGEANPQSGP